MEMNVPYGNRPEDFPPPRDFSGMNESDRNDFQTALGYAVAVPEGRDFVPEEEAAPFMASEEGKIAQDVFASQGLSDETIQQVKVLWNQFHAKQDTIPDVTAPQE